jgi:DNA-binding response OmpR family regulator
MNNNHILVVDDELNLIRSLSFVLVKEGFEVMTASDGEEALQQVRRSKPDLIFLDVMMPQKNGYEVCEALRAVPEFRSIYIIMLSAKGTENDKTQALKVGADEFISKPFSPLEAVSRAKKALCGIPL